MSITITHTHTKTSLNSIVTHHVKYSSWIYKTAEWLEQPAEEHYCLWTWENHMGGFTVSVFILNKQINRVLD